MIILPLATEPVPAAAPLPRPASAHSTLRVVVLGFSPAEHKLLEGVVELSRRRSVRLEVVAPEAAATADVVMLDAADAQTREWAASRPFLAGKTVIWVDGRQAGSGPTQLRRPIQWPSLPALLLRALGLEAPDSARAPLPAAH